MPSPSISVELSREEAKVLDRGFHSDGGAVLQSARAKLRAALDSDPERKDRRELLNPLDQPEFDTNDARRLGGIAWELEHAPKRIRRFFDQDGRDARYLRILQARIVASLAPNPDQEGEGR